MEQLKEVLHQVFKTAPFTPFPSDWSFDNGYLNSKAAIIDANITTIIAAIILFVFGSGPVKGFSVTLSVGIITTLFTVYFIARLLTATYVISNKNKEMNI